MSQDSGRFTSGAFGVAALFVRRPVLAIVLNLLIVVAGIAAFMRHRSPRIAECRPTRHHHPHQL